LFRTRASLISNAEVSGEALAAGSFVIEKPPAASALPLTKSDDLDLSGKKDRTVNNRCLRLIGTHF